MNDGVILRDHLKTILENFHLSDILDNEREWEKLWSKFDLDNVSMVRTNVFLRLLEYRVNLADEINADIQRLVSRSSAAGMIERSHPSSASKKFKRLPVIKPRENREEIKHSAPPPSTALVEPAVLETTQVSTEKSTTTTNDNEQSNQTAARELSTKFRTIVQQHRKMVKQLNETDEFVPFLDRKVKNEPLERFPSLLFDSFIQVNEGYFCLKTVFAYLDPKQIHQISNEQLIVALNQFDIPLSSENIEQFLQKYFSER